MRRYKISSATLIGLALLSSCLPAESIAQSATKAKQRGARFNTKPGEVITRPDLSERWENNLLVGEKAPEFTLPLLPKQDKAAAAKKPAAADKQSSVTLSELCAKRPAVLIFGSITCPPFRSQLDDVDQVYKDFQDRAEFLFVYIREAHPDSVLSVVGADGGTSLVKIPQAEDATARQSSAAFCSRTLELSMPIVVDKLDNSVGKAYAGWPNRMVVVGTDGKVIYASDPAPGGTNAERLRAWLKQNLPPAK